MQNTDCSFLLIFTPLRAAVGRDAILKMAIKMANFLYIAGFAAALLVVTGCDTSGRISRLEKQNQELQAAVANKERATADYELQAKCGRDAKIWFDANWPHDKDTLLLTYTNHYNKAQNKCFILIEYHFNVQGLESSWTNNMSLWDIYENVSYGMLAENYTTYHKPEFRIAEEVVNCELLSNKCKTMDEFNNLIRPYLNN